MCRGLFICHGDKAEAYSSIYTEEQIAQFPKDCKPAVFYITNDGKYAIDADFVSLEDVERVDLGTVPNIKLK